MIRKPKTVLISSVIGTIISVGNRIFKPSANETVTIFNTAKSPSTEPKQVDKKLSDSFETKEKNAVFENQN